MKKVFVITMVVVLCGLSVVAEAASRRGNPSDHGVLLGSKIVDNMRIKFEMEPSKGMWMLMGGEWTWMGTMGKPYHLEVKLEDPYSETRISYSNVALTMINVTTGHGVGNDMLHPMWGGSGLHYGANAVVAPGTYDVTVDIGVPEFARSDSDASLYIYVRNRMKYPIGTYIT